MSNRYFLARKSRVSIPIGKTFLFTSALSSINMNVLIELGREESIRRSYNSIFEEP